MEVFSKGARTYIIPLMSISFKVDNVIGGVILRLNILSTFKKVEYKNEKEKYI